MLPPNQPPEPEKNKTSPPNGPPQNLWKQLEPHQQKTLAQRWGQLLRRMQLSMAPNTEAPDVDN